MKNLELEGFGLVEMGKEEMMEIDGGKVKYVDYVWCGGGAIHGIADAAYNAGALVYNAGAAIVNWWNS